MIIDLSNIEIVIYRSEKNKVDIDINYKCKKNEKQCEVDLFVLKRFFTKFKKDKIIKVYEDLQKIILEDKEMDIDENAIDIFYPYILKSFKEYLKEKELDFEHEINTVKQFITKIAFVWKKNTHPTIINATKNDIDNGLMIHIIKPIDTICSLKEKTKTAENKLKTYLYESNLLPSEKDIKVNVCEIDRITIEKLDLGNNSFKEHLKDGNCLVYIIRTRMDINKHFGEKRKIVYLVNSV